MNWVIQIWMKETSNEVSWLSIRVSVLVQFKVLFEPLYFFSHSQKLFLLISWHLSDNLQSNSWGGKKASLLVLL